MSCSFLTLQAAEETPNHNDVSDKEHRHRITNWLSLAATIEFEQGQERQVASDDTKTKSDEFSKSFDLEFFLELSENLKSDIALEYDDENGGFLVDEANVIFDLDVTKIEIGKTTLPFGKYSTNFINDSPIKFAEIKAKSVIISYKAKNNIDLSLFTYRGHAKSSNTNRIKWGSTTEFSPSESWKFGVGYLSDLADSEDIDLGANISNENRVAGISAYSLYKFSNFNLSTEFTSALDGFQEFEEDRNKPLAWNLEFAHKLSNKFDWALRFAGSRELKDEPYRQYGISGSWQINKKMTLSLEYLENDFINGLAENIQERPLKKSKGIAAQLSISF